MCDSRFKWVRIFNIPEHSKHKKGFTIYKIVSLLYPEEYPDAITKITVWKRFNDFKALHCDLRQLLPYKKTKINLPPFLKTSFFKRFDEDTIADRIEFMLAFLDFTAMNAELFTSNVMVKFFETSRSPSDVFAGNIESIRADLNLPDEAEVSPFYHIGSEDENSTFSDTDSISTLSTISHLGNNIEVINETQQGANHVKVHNVDPTLISKSLTKAINSGFLNPILEYTSDPIEIDLETFYIINASEHIKKAVDLEAKEDYVDAFHEYKLGIDILLTFVKDDKNFERREMIRLKTARYLLRAEKIYNMYLSNGTSVMIERTPYDEKKPTTDLANYKVVKILGTAMIANYISTNKVYYIKVIQKNTMFSANELILPDAVRHMVKLHKFFNCEDIIVLILDYIEDAKNCIQYVTENNPTNGTDISNFVDAYAEDTNDEIESEVHMETSRIENTRQSLITKWAVQLLLALENLHYLGIICRDVRVDNVLVDKNGDVLLTYMSHVNERRDFPNEIHVAPEIKSVGKYSRAVDWWSYGVILYELITGTHLNKIHREGYFSYSRLRVPDHISSASKSLLKQLLVVDAAERLGSGPCGIEDIKSHPFFSDIDWRKLSSKSPTKRY